MKKLYLFFRDGFRSMTIGRTLWVLVLVKLFIMFAILKVFFFPDFLSDKGNDEQQSEYVSSELIN
ncbi:MAG: DUF4492 domain-containing protein [Bacteroidales bacterium]|jgi:hypothetical protein|nr:DUF4492 domain-containing protein [Bacteroidales bacterium]